MRWAFKRPPVTNTTGSVDADADQVTDSSISQTGCVFNDFKNRTAPLMDPSGIMAAFQSHNQVHEIIAVRGVG